MSAKRRDHEPLYAVSAEFTSPEAVLAAARTLRPRALGKMQIFSPVPLAEAGEAVGRTSRPLPQMAAVAAFVVGFLGMMGMCLYATAYDYAFDVGGRPRFSWPAFMVPSVSFGVLLVALVLFLAFTFLCRLPLLNHPCFNIPGFLRASQDRFFLTVEPSKGVDPTTIERMIAGLSDRPVHVSRVPR